MKIKEKLSHLRMQLTAFSSQEKWFMLFAMMCGFLICMEYSIIRPVSNSLFIHSYGADFFPKAWLVLVPFNLLIVSLYNRFLQRLGCFKMFLVIILTVMTGNLFAAIFFKKISFLPFMFYVWKEVYILLMFQQLWSVIHSTVKLDHAKYLYGIFFGIGGLGSICGSLLPGFFAISMGSEQMLFFSLPLYLLLTFCYFQLVKFSGASQINRVLPKVENSGFMHGINLIRSSRFLTFILLIVVFMQLSSSIVDFQLNSYLEHQFPDKDLRTEISARILSIVHMMSIGLQFLGTFILVRFLGIKRLHYLIPALLGAGAVSYLFFPLLPMLCASYISTKSFDFSLFGVAKELLYVPLKPDEKFRAKSIIDVFAYRSSKALSAFLILIMQSSFVSLHLSYSLTLVNIAIMLLWLFIVSRLFVHKTSTATGVNA